MEKRALGKTGINVTSLGFGAGQIGDLGLPDETVNHLLNLALDSGINLIDTARGYYASEDRIGRFISRRREEFVLSTKVGYGIEGYQDWTYDGVLAGIDYALQLMKTDYLDIVFLHSCPQETLQQGAVIEALEEAKKAGKIRATGYSGENDDFDYALATSRFDVLMASYNICDQNIANRSFQLMERQGTGFIAKRPVANAPWRFDQRPVGHYAETYWERWQAMKIDSALPLQEIALRFAIGEKGVHSCIVGTTNPEHLLDNLAIAAKGPLPGDLQQHIRDAFLQADQDWPGQV